MGLEPIRGDVLDPVSLQNLPETSTVLYAVGMDRSAGRNMREVYVQGLASVLRALPPGGRFLYVSSTGVYGQTGGEWVTEADATEPREESGAVVLEAERTLFALRPDAVILRFAGIYGPGRLLRRDALLQGAPLTSDAEKWLNLIHVDDGVRAVLAAETRAKPGAIYNVADDTPMSRRDFYTHLAQLLQAPPAQFAPTPAPVEKPEANRRIRNERAKAELGFAPDFPSYREGLCDAVSRS
jgi:nucleoside-diphosphate-sugar epimerase